MDLKKETIEKILEFRDERNWRQFHNPKDLAISINLEAGELLEVFQWSGIDMQCDAKNDKIREELADVLIYCVLMADTCGFEINEIINKKLLCNEKKYPVQKAYGSNTKYHDLK